MDKARISNRIASFDFWVLIFGQRSQNSKPKTQNSKPLYPLSILMILTLVFSKLENTNAQKINSFTMNWQIVDSLPAPNIGVAGAYSGVHNGAMLVAGGANFPKGLPWEGGKKNYSDTVYVFTKNKNGSLKRLNQIFHLPNSMAYGASVSTPKGIVCLGGENEKGLSKQAFLMLWNKKIQVIECQNLTDLPIPLTNASATADGNTVFMAGGETTNAVSDKFYSLDLNNKILEWKELPALPKPLSHSVLAFQKHGKKTCIYVAGGRQKKANGISDIFATLFEFDVATNRWTEKKPMPYALSAGTGIAVGSNTLLMFGGDKGETFHQVETLLAAINAENDEVKKQALIAQKNQLLTTHPGFTKDIISYNTQTDEWTKIGDMPFDAPVTTTVFKWKNRVIIPSGEIKAGVRTPHILAVDILQNEK